MDNPNDKQPTETDLSSTPQSTTTDTESSVLNTSEPKSSDSSQPSESDHLADIEMGEDSNPSAPAVNSANTSAIDQVLSNDTPIATQTVAKPAQDPTDLSGVIQKPKKKKLGLIIGLIIALAILIGGGAVAFKTLIIDNQPQNLVDRAISNSFNTTKPIKATYQFTPIDKNNSNSPLQSIKGHVTFDPTTKLANYNVDLSNQMFGDNQINLLADSSSKKVWLKVNFDKKLFSLLSSILPTRLDAETFISKFYQATNNQWFLIDEASSKDLLKNTDPKSQKSLDSIKKLSEKCRNYQDLADIKFMEVIKELDAKDHYRNFEVKFNKSHFQNSLTANTNNQCATAIKEFIDDNQSKLKSGKQTKTDNQPKIILTIDTKTKLVNALKITDNRAKLETDFNYAVTDKLEVPKQAKPITELQAVFDDLMKRISFTKSLKSSRKFPNR